MSEASHSLSSSLVEKILQSVGAGHTGAADDIEAAEYDWSKPHSFDAEQSVQLMEIAGVIAGSAAETLAGFFQKEFDVTAESVSEQFGIGSADEADSEEYFLGFGTEQKVFGAVCVPRETAAAWARQLLGDSGSDGDSRTGLSRLEESLLVDTASTLVKALCAADPVFSNMRAAAQVERETAALGVDDTEEMYRIVLSMKTSDESHAASIIVESNRLRKVLGEEVDEDASAAAEDAAAAMHEHIHNIDVSLEATLGRAVLSFEELASLRRRDIVLLDNVITDPTEIAAEGKTVFRGAPAMSAGKYAVVITELCGEQV